MGIFFFSKRTHFPFPRAARHCLASQKVRKKGNQKVTHRKARQGGSRASFLPGAGALSGILGVKKLAHPCVHGVRRSVYRAHAVSQQPPRRARAEKVETGTRKIQRKYASARWTVKQSDGEQHAALNSTANRMPPGTPRVRVGFAIFYFRASKAPFVRVAPFARRAWVRLHTAFHSLDAGCAESARCETSTPAPVRPTPSRAELPFR